MKCPHCNESLEMLKGNTKIKGCPYCLQPLDPEIFLTTVKERLAYLVKSEGKSIYRQQNWDKLCEKMADWPKSFAHDRDILKMLFVKNIPEAMVNASEASGEGAKSILEECLDSLVSGFYIPEDKAMDMLTLVGNSLEMDVAKSLCSRIVRNSESSSEKVSDVSYGEAIVGGRSVKIVRFGGLTWMAEDYGGLVTWDDAVKNAPYGWRLPTVNELELLQRHFDDVVLKMNFKYAGCKVHSEGVVLNKGVSSYFWSLSQEHTSMAYRINIDCSSKTATIYCASKEFLYSVRYVKD